MQATRPDHVLVSGDALPFVQSSVVNTGRRDPDHHHIETMLHISVGAVGARGWDGRGLHRVHWRSAAQDAYAAALDTAGAPDLAACQRAAAGGQVEEAFHALDQGVRAAAAASGLRSGTGRQHAASRVHAPFFDEECLRLKRQVRACASPGGDQDELKRLERRYHSLVRSKRRAHRKQQLQRLAAEQHQEPRRFWQRLRQQQSPLPEQLYSVDAWDGFLQQVAKLDAPPAQGLPDAAFPQQHAGAPAVAELDVPITLKDVTAGLQRLRSGRAKGKQGLPAELLKYAHAQYQPGQPPSPNKLAHVLVGVLNCAFQAGQLQWQFDHSCAQAWRPHSASQL